MEENRTTAGKMPLRNAVCCFLGALIWGTAFVAQRIGSDEIPVSAFVGIRFLMGFAVLLPLVIARERMRRRRIAQGDRTVEPPAVLSVRGYGKYRIDTLGDKTRKGRLRLLAVRYI